MKVFAVLNSLGSLVLNDFWSEMKVYREGLHKRVQEPSNSARRHLLESLQSEIGYSSFPRLDSFNLKSIKSNYVGKTRMFFLHNHVIDG